MIGFIYYQVDAQSYASPDGVFDVDHLFINYDILVYHSNSTRTDLSGLAK